MSLTLQDLKYINAYVWWVYSMITLVPLLLLSIKKLCYPLRYHKYNDRMPFPTLLEDKIAFIFLFYAPFYYIFDIMLAFLLAEFHACGISFMFHHTVSIIFLPTVILQNHYPWFLCLVPCLHAVLITFPHMTFLNYFYLVACGLYQYGLYQEPFRNMKSYRFLHTGTWILEVTLMMLWGFGCKNDF